MYARIYLIECVVF